MGKRAKIPTEYIKNSKTGIKISKLAVIEKLKLWAADKRTIGYMAKQLGLETATLSNFLKQINVNWKDVKRTGIFVNTHEIDVLGQIYQVLDQDNLIVNSEKDELLKQSDLLQGMINKSAHNIAVERIKKEDERKDASTVFEEGIEIEDENGKIIWTPDDQFRNACRHIKYAEKNKIVMKFPDVIKYLKDTEQLKAKQKEIASDHKFFNKFRDMFNAHIDDLAIISEDNEDPMMLMLNLKEYYDGHREVVDNLSGVD